MLWVCFLSNIHSYTHSQCLAHRHFNDVLHWFIYPLTPKRVFPVVWTLHAKDRFCNVTRCQSVKMRTLHLQHRQLLQDNNFQHKIASIQTGSWPDSHENGSETKAPHNHHLLSFACQISYASPAVEMAAHSEAAAMRCSFMSWQRNLFFYLPPPN